MIERRQPDRPHLDPDRFQRKTASAYVPSVSRDRAAWAHNAHHLSNALGRIGNEENHQRHGGRVESIIRDRKRHGVAAIEFGQTRRRPRARKGELGLGWINALDFNRCASFDEQFAERAIAAADVDPPQARRRRQPIYEYRAGNPAPLSHHPFVGGAVVEANLTLGHEYFCPRRSGSSDSSGSQPFCHL